MFPYGPGQMSSKTDRVVFLHETEVVLHSTGQKLEKIKENSSFEIKGSSEVIKLDPSARKKLAFRWNANLFLK